MKKIMKKLISKGLCGLLTRIIRGAPSKITKLLSRDNQSLNINPYINKDGSLNIDNIKYAYNLGTDDAINFLSSKTYLYASRKNLELANRLGFDFYNFSNEALDRVKTKPRLRVAYAPDYSIAGSVQLNFDPSKEVISLNVVKNPIFSSFHELMHRGFYGMGYLPKRDLSKLTKQQMDDFYSFLAEKILKPKELLLLEGIEPIEYLEHPNEVAVNLLEIGKRMGLTPGQPYPGDEVFKQMIDSFENSNDYKTGIFKYLNTNKLKRIWDALTGLYFSFNIKDNKNSVYYG